eukprot:jgi/Botrbrau1/10620/Bobra.154_1s0010.1
MLSGGVGHCACVSSTLIVEEITGRLKQTVASCRRRSPRGLNGNEAPQLSSQIITKPWPHSFL